MKQVKFINVEHGDQVLTNLGITLAICQVILILAFGIFVRMNTNPPLDPLDHERPIAFTSINLMLLLGFGLLMTAPKNNSLTALVYTLLLVAIAIQLYIVLQGFWVQVFTAFKQQINIYVDEVLLIKACYCVASSLIAMSAVIGRINPTDMVKMVTLHAVGYTLNEQIVYRAIGAEDAGGGTVVHIFGAYYGLTVSYVLAKYVLPATRPERTYHSNLLALLGTLFLWIFWPLFNFGAFANNSFERTLIITNTYCSLASSTIAVFIVTAIHGRGILINDIQHATLVGGVAIAAPCGIIYVPAIALTIGFLTGLIATNCLHYLNRRLEKSLKILDPHSVHSTHGIPGLIGVLASAFILMLYSTGYDFSVAAKLPTGTIFNPSTSFMKQGALQLLAIISSLGIAILMGFAAGKFIGLFYQEKEEYFFQDSTYFDRNLFLNMDDRQVRYEQAQRKKVPIINDRVDRHQRTDQTEKKKKKSERRSRPKQK